MSAPKPDRDDEFLVTEAGIGRIGRPYAEHAYCDVENGTLPEHFAGRP